MKRRTGAHVQCKQAERVGPVHLGKEAVPERPYSSIDLLPPVAEEGQQERCSGTADKGGQG